MSKKKTAKKKKAAPKRKRSKPIVIPPPKNDIRLKQDFALALVQYLATRPYVEVHEFMHALHTAEEIPPKGTAG